MTIITDLVGVQLQSAAGVIGFLHGANIGFTGSVLRKIGLFYVRVGAKAWLESGEDADVVYRALIANVPVYYDPHIIVIHDYGRYVRRDRLQMMRGYDVGMGAMGAKIAFPVAPICFAFFIGIRDRSYDRRQAKWT